jgi:hypothetical protein
VFDRLITSGFDGTSEAAISLLQEIAQSHEMTPRRWTEPRMHQRQYDSHPLQKLPPGEWRSLGGYFDYSHWIDRDRFMELDRAIAASQHGQMFAIEADDGIF